MAMMSEWKVSYNPMGGYIAYRIRNTNEVDHSGNREYFGDYSNDKEVVEKNVEQLNKGEIVP